MGILIQLGHTCVVPVGTFVTISRNRTIHGRINGEGYLYSADYWLWGFY